MKRLDRKTCDVKTQDNHEIFLAWAWLVRCKHVHVMTQHSSKYDRSDSLMLETEFPLNDLKC